MNGDAGDDRLIAGFGDSVDGGTGTDTLSLSLLGASAGVTGDLGAAFTGGTATFAGGSFTGLEQYREIVGSNFDDNITLGNATQGTDNNANNTTGFVGLYGRDGNDVLTGGTASNDLYGDNGNDTLNGLGGNDRLTGGAGADTLNGGDGNDILYSDHEDFTDGATGTARRVPTA
ncbi:calcium-binding protein [Hankyongella ginsenosidimutans]|uniref:Calcium-binding protein n=1 Tax=Hankyongella ginsenosidimutans TaxID=1763828 RepID=A0A4D7C850_9SPHN|nr:calcium-binding protein [Hankyongella ginsenosidimutans]